MGPKTTRSRADSRKTTDGKWKKVKQEEEREEFTAVHGTEDNKKQSRQQTADGSGTGDGKRKR
jgi:hypothetical protein